MISTKNAVQHQFDQCVQHYLQDSPMADGELLGLIARLAEPCAHHHTLDVACGAGFLVAELARSVARAVGVDLSSAMLAAARENARVLGLTNAAFHLADSEKLPFARAKFDIVSCKLALHYFPDPGRALDQMKRVLKQQGRLVLVDRVSSEDRQHQAQHNRIEKLRTPSKTRVYSTSEILALLEEQGLTVEEHLHYEQHQEVDDWLATTGAPEENRQHARELLLNSEAGLKLFHSDGRLQMTHNTAIFIARKRSDGVAGNLCSNQLCENKLPLRLAVTVASKLPDE